MNLSGELKGRTVNSFQPLGGQADKFIAF